MKTMASQEQINLSTFIKSVHKDLRQSTKLLGAQLAWENHCRNKATLSKYSQNMMQLATDYWNKNHTNGKVMNNRIYWTQNICVDYFLNTNLMHLREKEETIASKLNINVNGYEILTPEKIKLLDVGSCYSPFKSFNKFEVTAIDIAPANSDVYECDFLNVLLSSKFKHQKQCLLEIPRDYFHVIVFSLFLEYLPTPAQRELCCQKAYNLLRREGLLIIITPDSKHVGANVKIMKSWRHLLAKMGFNRIKYEKLQHIHCMAFRKCLNSDIAKRWSFLHDTDDVFKEMSIPQDFNNIQKDNNVDTCSDSADSSLFQHLPFDND